MAYGWSAGIPASEFKRQFIISTVYTTNEKSNRVIGYQVKRRADRQADANATDTPVTKVFKGSDKGYELAKAWIAREHLKASKREAKERETGKRRQRTVYPTGEIPHLWAHRIQSEARNPQGNLYFHGDTIYSYGSHFPIARHVKNERGKSAVLFTTRKYSSTTAQHIWAVRSSIPEGVTVFNVPTVSERNSSLAMERYLADARDAMQSARAARRWGLSKLAKAIKLREECKKYCKFFAVTMPVENWKSIIPTGKAYTNLVAELTAKEKRARELQAEASKRERERRERERAEWEAGEPERKRLQFLAEWDAAIAEDEERRRLPETIARWRAGENVHLPYYRSDRPGTMLRIVNGDTVETSMGARVPVEHAARGLKLVKACMSTGREYKRNGHTVHLGHYAIDSIDVDGTLKAGCHVIKWEEIQRIAPDLEGKVSADDPLCCETERPHKGEFIDLTADIRRLSGPVSKSDGIGG